MGEVERLRDEARRLRAAGGAMREKGAALDDEVRAVRRNYPLPSDTLWDGPYALEYKEHLDDVVTGLDVVTRRVDRYADDCEERALTKEREADELERQAVAAGGDG